MKLPIPIFCQEKIYTDIELKIPSPGTIADTVKVIETNNHYSGILTFITGCIHSLTDSDDKTLNGVDKNQIRNIMSYITYESASYLSIQGMLKYDEDDSISGVYECPLCHEKVICKKTMESDNRDHINDLKITCMKEKNPEFVVILNQPLELTNKSTGQLLDEEINIIESITFEYPKISSCIKASHRYGKTDRIRLQYYIYSESIKKINGQDVDNKWRSRWGMWIIEHLPHPKKDLSNITKESSKFGMENTVMRICPECGNEWDAPVNTANFFASALQSE